MRSARCLVVNEMSTRCYRDLVDLVERYWYYLHNTSINKLGYSPLQLMTGKAVTLPGLTTGNEATESMTDSEAVQRTMENLAKTT